jgi:hypothetical protein
MSNMYSPHQAVCYYGLPRTTLFNGECQVEEPHYTYYELLARDKCMPERYTSQLQGGLLVLSMVVLLLLFGIFWCPCDCEKDDETEEDEEEEEEAIKED